SCIIHQNIKTPKCSDGGLDGVLCLVEFAYIPLHRNSFAAILFDFLDHFIRRIRALVVIYHNLCAQTCEPNGNRAPDAAGCARDERDLAVEFNHALAPAMYFSIWS